MKILNPFLLFIFLFSCATKNEEENHRIISLEDFKEISLNSEKHYFQEVINASSFALQGDKILISEYHNIPDKSPRIHIINTSDWTYDKPKGRYGKGPLETFIPEFIVSRDTERFLVYDYNNRKISTFSINDTSLLATSDRKITNPNFGPMRLALTPNRNYLGVARENENKLLEFDLEGSLIAEYGEFEKLEERPELTKLQISLLSNGRFHGNPKNGIYVRASIYRDLLEIFDYKTKKFISVAGPDLNLPEFEYHQSEFGGMLSFEPDVHFKYQAVTVTNNYIFVLYSGFSQLDYSNTGSVAKEIRVFDLNGNPKWRLILDRSISGLGVNEKSNEIYGLTTDKDPGIAVFQIPDEALN